MFVTGKEGFCLVSSPQGASVASWEVLQLAEVAEDLDFHQFPARFVSGTEVIIGRAETVLLRREEVFMSVSHFCSNVPLNECSCPAWQHLQERCSSFETMPPEKNRIMKRKTFALFFLPPN